MAIRKPDWDEELRRRAKTEDCPIPQDFEKRLGADVCGKCTLQLPCTYGIPNRDGAVSWNLQKRIQWTR